MSITYSTLSFTTYSDDIASGVIGYSTGNVFITNTKMFSVIEAANAAGMIYEYYGSNITLTGSSIMTTISYSDTTASTLIGLT